MQKILLATAAAVLFSSVALAQTTSPVIQSKPQGDGERVTASCDSMVDPLARARCLSVAQPPMGLAEVPAQPITGPGLPPVNIATCNNYPDMKDRTACLRNLPPAAPR